MKTPRFGLLTAASFLALSMAGAGLVGCSVTGPLREDAKATGYQLGSLPSAWKRQDLDSGADVVFLQTKTKSLISVNSVCDRYTDSKLETLTQDLLSPIKAVVIDQQEDLKISGRRALRTAVSGKLDGVSVQSELIVLRKNRCLFDFSIFGISIAETERAQFLRFAQGFQFQESK